MTNSLVEFFMLNRAREHLGSRVGEEGHEAVIHVELLVAVE